jgi:hypothetical protein
MRYIRKAFGKGVRTFFRHHPQRGYVYLQEYLPGNPGDYRILCHGTDLVSGFFRRNREGAPLASGSGVFETPELPDSLLDFVSGVHQRLGEQVMSYDVLRDRAGAWVITEMSVIYGDLSHVIYDQIVPYKRDRARGEWVREAGAGDRHDRLVRLLLTHWGSLDG